jgi:hypothetical protein
VPPQFPTGLGGRSFWRCWLWALTRSPGTALAPHITSLVYGEALSAIEALFMNNRFTADVLTGHQSLQEDKYSHC